MIAGSQLELGLAVIYGQSVLQVPYSFFFWGGGGGCFTYFKTLNTDIE